LLYPEGLSRDQVMYAARLKLPAGWKYATALPAVGQDGGTIDFAPATLSTLVDSPVAAGAHVRVVPLGSERGVTHELDLVADSEEELEMTRQQLAAYHQLVAEAQALFGARHYRDYHFLYTLSDKVPFFGLEHHESSDDRVAERTLLEDDRRRAFADLLPHEFVHSWNGKYRRPRGLATRDYGEPMRGDLLWVYEGLTEYLGWVLTGRSGLLSEDEERESLAETAARMDEMLVESDDYFKSLAVDWHGGERHPHLARDGSRPDLIAQILAPRTPRPAEAVAAPPHDGDDTPPGAPATR
jgi:predicted metalloprotease with PDZ domain